MPNYLHSNLYEKEKAVELYEYKVLWNKRTGVLAESWFDGDRDLGAEITTELLNIFGSDGWSVVGTMQAVSGTTHKIILQRPAPQS
jgi:hypothetical protein